MRSIEVLKSPDSLVSTVISNALQSAVLCDIASAYLTKRGLDTFERHFEHILQNDGNVTVVHGADCRITDPEAIRRLANLNLQFEKMRYRVRLPYAGIHGPSFHPKVYLVADAVGHYTSVIGSSNATFDGLNKNVEVNVVMRGNRRNPMICESLRTFDALMQDSHLIEPGGEWVASYEKLFAQMRSLRSEANDPEVQELYHELIRLSPQVENWTPSTQTECVIKALQEMESGTGHKEGIRLDDIYRESQQVAKRYGRMADWSTKNWKHSIRRCLNTNTEGKGGLRVFERVGGERSRSGVYRLSERGKIYHRE